MKIELIDTQSKLNEFISSSPNMEIVCIDTEFLRRNTYFAKLSLVQVSFGDKVFIFDATRIDFQKIWWMILDSKALIIVHAGRQDLEILYRLYGRLPSNLADTQIMAKYAGFRSYISYSELCQEICGIEIDKTHQNCNWMIRELSNSQLEYAASDVVYLQELYCFLKERIANTHLCEEALAATRKELLNDEIYKIKSEEAWKKVRFHNKQDYFISRMQTLAAFREDSASALDIPRGFFLTDVQLVQICNILPRNLKDLRQVKNLKKWIFRPQYSAKLFEISSKIASLDDIHS